jgi:hypothetical protein
MMSPPQELTDQSPIRILVANWNMRLREFEIADQGEPTGGVAATKWLSEHRWRRVRAAEFNGDQCGNATDQAGGDGIH